MSRKRTHKVKTKQRIESLRGTTSGVVSQISVTYDSETGGFEISGVDPATLRSEIFYERDSGKDKIVLSVPAKSNLPAFDSWRQVTGQVAHLIAIDTNSRVVNGKRVSVTFACYIPNKLQNLGKYFYFEPLCSYAVLDVVAAASPERIGWHLILREHLNMSLIPPEEKLGIVVDSELGRLNAINSRTEAYYETHMLPDRMLMMYASDAAAGPVLADMIKFCDTSARRMLDHIEAESIEFPATVGNDPNYRNCFFLDFKRT